MPNLTPGCKATPPSPNQTHSVFPGTRESGKPFSVSMRRIQHINAHPEVLRLFKSMHLSGVTAEDKPGAKKQPMRRLNSSVSGPDSGFLCGAGEGI